MLLCGTISFRSLRVLGCTNGAQCKHLIRFLWKLKFSGWEKGFKVDTVLSLYDALKVVSQEMPHLVISDSILTDGTAGTLYDRMSQHPMLKNTPIMVLVAKKTREQLTPLTGRKFAGFLLSLEIGHNVSSKVR